MDFVAAKGPERISNFPKYVLSLDPVRMDRRGIRHMNVIDFLMGEML